MTLIGTQSDSILYQLYLDLLFIMSIEIVLWSSMDKWELWLSFVYLGALGWQCLAGLISWVHSKEGACLVLGAESVLLAIIVGISWLSKRLIGSGPNSNKLRQNVPICSAFQTFQIRSYNGYALIMEWARIACALQHSTVISYQKSFYDVILWWDIP